MSENIKEPVKQMMEIQQRGLELFKKKNADYGSSYKVYGLIGILVRLEDKIKRCLSITNSGITLVDDERLEDTLLDLHNYAAMALMLLSENNLETKSKKENSDIDVNKGQLNAGL